MDTAIKILLSVGVSLTFPFLLAALGAPWWLVLLGLAPGGAHSFLVWLFLDATKQA